MSRSYRSLTVTVHDFKTNFSRYLSMLNHEEQQAIIVRRYKKDIALLLSLDVVERNRKADESLREIRLWRAACKRIENERRIHRARMNSWPGHKLRDALLAGRF